jgi:hypothetical protein
MQKWRFKFDFKANATIIDPRVTRLRLLWSNGWAVDKRMEQCGVSAYLLAIRCCKEMDIMLVVVHWGETCG